MGNGRFTEILALCTLPSGAAPASEPHRLGHKQSLLFQNAAVISLKAEPELSNRDEEPFGKKSALKMFTFSYLMVLDHILLA